LYHDSDIVVLMTDGGCQWKERKHLPRYIHELEMAVTPDVETAKPRCVYSQGQSSSANGRKVNPILGTFEGLTACASKRLEPGYEYTHTQYGLYAGWLGERDHVPSSGLLSHNLSLLHTMERSCVNAESRVKARHKNGRRHTEPSRPVLDGDLAFGSVFNVSHAMRWTCILVQ
jgi:hypothetical protein